MNFFDRITGTLQRKPQYPVISFQRAVEKVLKGDYRTVGKRNSEKGFDVFLCTSTGHPLAIVDFEGRGARETFYV